MTHNLITVAQFRNLINASVGELDFFLKSNNTETYRQTYTKSCFCAKLWGLYLGTLDDIFIGAPLQVYRIILAQCYFCPFTPANHSTCLTRYICPNVFVFLFRSNKRKKFAHWLSRAKEVKIIQQQIFSYTY